MSNPLDEIDGVQRWVGRAGEARVVRLSRRYDAPIAEVWDALTNAERISRWFLPITGDLRLGGHYQLEGNAGGDILECDEPNRFRVTWIFGEMANPGDMSELEVRLTDMGHGKTAFELEHTATVPDEMWAQYGPGAVGVGWDGAVLGLTLHLRGESIADPMAWMQSAEARRFYTLTSEKWGAANVASGADPAAAAAAVKNSTEFYAPAEAEAG